MCLFFEKSLRFVRVVRPQGRHGAGEGRLLQAPAAEPAVRALALEEAEHPVEDHPAAQFGVFAPIALTGHFARRGLDFHLLKIDLEIFLGEEADLGGVRNRGDECVRRGGIFRLRRYLDRNIGAVTDAGLNRSSGRLGTLVANSLQKESE